MTNHHKTTEPDEPIDDHGHISQDILERVRETTYVTDPFQPDTNPTTFHEFRASTTKTLHAIRAQTSENSPVTVGIDLARLDRTTAHHGPNAEPTVDTDTEPDETLIAVITSVSTPVPLILGLINVDPGGHDDPTDLPILGLITRSLISQATAFVDIDTVLAPRVFHTDPVLAELHRRDLAYVIPARKTQPIREMTAAALNAGAPDLATAFIAKDIGDHQYVTLVTLLRDDFTDEEYAAILTREEVSPAGLPELLDQLKQRRLAGRQATTLRDRLTTTPLPTGRQRSNNWAAAIDVNAHAHAHHLIGDRLDPGEAVFTDFDQFLQTLHAHQRRTSGGDRR